MTLREIISTSSVVICGGPGGVGKTSVAAALALGAARAGRRACVVTIDPARRLADALGIERAANLAQVVDGPWAGSLSAVMLDAAGTFDELVNTYAAGPEQVDRITSNRLYQNLIGSLSGTQEYMATERLFALHQSGEFDVIVVDTPPSRHAVDFLSAPRRLSGFLDNRVFRVLVSQSSGSLRAVSFATQLLLRTIAKVAGSEIIDDTIAFFRAFDGMEKGFRERASAVEALLNDPSTTYVLVSTARRAALDETTWLAERLVDEHHRVDALVVNKMLPLVALDESIDKDAVSSSASWTRLVDNARLLGDLAIAEETLLSTASVALHATVTQRLPMMTRDVADLASLDVLSRHLLSQE